jgi:methylmalonyl-CoA/ethylmalonyl-CoA epimerase
MTTTFHHLGIVVNNVEEVGKLYSEMLGLEYWKQGTLEDTENGVRLLSLPSGDTFIELVQPIRSDNRFARALKEKGEGLFHLCFFSDDFDKEVNTWKEKGYIIEEEIANSFKGHPFRLAWISPKSTHGVWIELSDISALPDHGKH